MQNQAPGLTVCLVNLVGPRISCFAQKQVSCYAEVTTLPQGSTERIRVSGPYGICRRVLDFREEAGERNLGPAIEYQGALRSSVYWIRRQWDRR